MALARKYQIIPGQSGFFHCYSRCVRRAFLCGCDPLTGKDFSHRRQWIVDRLELLSQAFAIDIYAYAVMSNHLHIVLFVDPARTQHWNDKEVIARWRSIYRWRNPDDDAPLPTPDQLGPAKLAVWRERLGNVSWFMKSLNEPLANIANAEDDCRGHFWEGRFGCTVLLDDPAVLAAMAYVDLNPIKAALADSMIDSDFTSIQQRLQDLYQPTIPEVETPDKVDSDTIAVDTSPITAVFSTAPPGGPTQKPGTTLQGYIALVEAAAGALSVNKPNIYPKAQQSLERFALPLPQWCQAVADFDRLFRRIAGAAPAVKEFVEKIGRQRRIDVAGARLLSVHNKRRSSQAVDTVSE